MHLADLIADAGHVEFFRLEVVAHEPGNLADEKDHLGELRRGKLMEVLDSFVYFWNDEDPGESGIVLQEDLAASGFSNQVAALAEACVEFEGHRFKKGLVR